MKHRIFIMMVGFISLSSLHPEERYINWSATRPLLWSDFQGQPDDSVNQAVTGAFLDIRPYIKNPYFRYLTSYFDKQKSWVSRPGNPDSITLIHEQGHFDIVEIYARKFNNEFNDIKMNAREKELDLQQKRFDEISKEMYLIQIKYDKETPFNQLEQIRWNKWIKKQLDSIPKIEFD